MENNEQYATLRKILDRAFNQAAYGKGRVRHCVGDQKFEDQPIVTIQKLVGDGFATGQAIKKLQESNRLPWVAAVAERLGAINFIAASIIYLEQKALEEGTVEKFKIPSSPSQEGIDFSKPADSYKTVPISDDSYEALKTEY